tara:strand:+ start:296 stop:1108 length:813 start_codon:yes stop_codon:yes gene_type:complete
LLNCENISFCYESKTVLREISLRIRRGERTAVLGPNGSGKTTLLGLFGGLLKPKNGRITLSGIDLADMSPTQIARRLAIVPQETRLTFDYSVLQMTLMGRYPHLKRFEHEGLDDYKIAREALAATGISQLEDRSYKTLSGGEKQRVVIASALTQLWQLKDSQKPSPNEGLLLLDEPTASLDIGYQLDIIKALLILNENHKTTLVISTHDLGLAARLSDEIIMIRHGRLLATGPTENTLTRETIRDLYDIEAEVHRNQETGHLMVVPLARK